MVQACPNFSKDTRLFVCCAPKYLDQSNRRAAMALQFRRVVTGHDATGRATVNIDEMAKNLASSRPGAAPCVVWTSQGFPVDNTAEDDAGLRRTGTTRDNGTVFPIL